MEIRIRTYEELRTDRVTIEITGTGAEVTEFAETRLPSRNLYTDEEVASLQASEAELVAGPLQARINELEDKLVRTENRIRGYDHDRHTERDRADRERQRASELKDRLSSSEELVQEERTRGNNLAQRLAQAEKSLAESRDLVAFKNRILNDKDDELREIQGLANRYKKRAEDAETRLMEGHVCTGGCSGNQHVAFVGRKALTEMENQVAALTRRIDNARVLLMDSQIKVAQDKAVTKAAVTMAEAIGKVLDTLA